jgi:type II secretory pathway pseudopilin PulG
MFPQDESSDRPIGATPNEIPKRIVRWAIILGVIALAYLVIVPPRRSFMMEQRKRVQAKATAGQLAAALQQYFAEYGSGFMVNTNAIVMGTLQGGNPRKIVFFETAPQWINAQGELIAPWGTPYSFDLSVPQNPRIWSCGKNRRDDSGAEGSDDIPSWR